METFKKVFRGIAIGIRIAFNWWAVGYLYVYIFLNVAGFIIQGTRPFDKSDIVALTVLGAFAIGYKLRQLNEWSAKDVENEQVQRVCN